MKLFTIMLLTVTLVLPAALWAVEKADPKKIAEIPVTPAETAKAADAVKFGEPLATGIDPKTGKPKLQPLVQDNRALLASWLSGQVEQPCGVACPKCGKEMVINTKLQLTTTPPARIVRCPDSEKCKFATAVF